MTDDQFVKSAYLRLNNKLPTFVRGSTKYEAMLETGNMLIGTWESEDDWQSLRSGNHVIGTVTATDTFPLPSTVNYISRSPYDRVTIKRRDGSISTFMLVKADTFDRYAGGVCAQNGRNLVFSQPFTATDADFGGTIYAPIYRYASRLLQPNDIVPVDDANWLVIACAAQNASASFVKAGMYDELKAEADELMRKMKRKNYTSQDNTYTADNFLLATEW